MPGEARARVVSASSWEGRTGDGGLTSSAAPTSRVFNVGGEATISGPSCTTAVKLSGGRGSTCGTEDSSGVGALGTEESINFSEPVALSVSTKGWKAVVAGGSVSFCDGACACGLNLSSLLCGGGTGAGGAGSFEGVNNA
jgi:hypothetical protein